MAKYNQSLLGIPMPTRIAALPITAKGYPTPWFAAEIDGVRDLRVIKPNGVAIAWKSKICWVCGQPLGRNLALVIGPMCAINRTISEPPSHRECAIYSACACPFLSMPRMRRNEVDLPENYIQPPGHPLTRNPTAACVWVTRDVRPFAASDGSGTLFTFGDPEEVLWFHQGKPASREEVMHSIDTGYPALQAFAQKDGPDGLVHLEKNRQRAMRYLPKAA